MEVKVNDILDIYNSIAKNIRNKRKIHLFEMNKMQNIMTIKTKLENNLNISKYNIFLIREPKERIIMSLNINDKIINHYVTKYILIPKLEKDLDIRNVATRKGYGSDYAIRLIKKYIEENKKYKNFYILKMDISKYFYNIDHDVLKNMLKEKLNKEEMDIISNILSSTNEIYVNKCIKDIISKNNLKDIPIYKYNKGLPIGNMTSQFLYIYYLNKLDHYIIHNLHLKYFVRYSDDIIIINSNKKYLNECLIKIENILNNDYKLKINKKKTYIKNIKDGFIFLGYYFKLKNNKTIIKVSGQTISKIKNNLKIKTNYYKNNNINLNSYFNCISNYLYSFKYGSYGKRKRIIDKCITDINF